MYGPGPGRASRSGPAQGWVGLGGRRLAQARLPRGAQLLVDYLAGLPDGGAFYDSLPGRRRASSAEGSGARRAAASWWEVAQEQEDEEGSRFRGWRFWPFTLHAQRLLMHAFQARQSRLKDVHGI